MIRKTFLTNSLYILSLFIIPFYARGDIRTKIDSFENELLRVKNDSVKITIFYNLENLYANTNPEKCFELNKSAIELSVKTKYLSGVAIGLNNLGILYWQKGKHIKAQHLYERALKIRKYMEKKHPDDPLTLRSIAAIYNNIALINWEFKKQDDALLFFGKAMEIRGKIKKLYPSDKRNLLAIASIYNNMGNVYEDLGNYPKAMNYYLAGLKIREEQKDLAGMCKSYGNLGLIYTQLNNLISALDYFQKALDLATETEDQSTMASSYNHIGVIYKKWGEYEKARSNYEKAITISIEAEDVKSHVLSLNNLGNIFLDHLKDYPRAYESYVHALDLLKGSDEKKALILCYNNMGMVLSKLDRKTEAKKMLNNALELSKTCHEKKYTSEIYKSFSEISYDQNDNYNAYVYFQLYVQTKDSILNEETSKQIAEMQSKYESEKKEKEILLLKKEKEIQQSEAQRQKIIRNSFIGASVLALLLALVLLNRYQIKKKANQKLTEQNEQIRKQKELIEEQKQNMTDSIEYASYIQKAVLPSDADFKEAFPDSFIFFRPRDIVSGDFYYLTAPPPAPPQMGREAASPPFGRDRGGALLALGDCTGHGVPGAFMSMLCNALLNEAVNDKGLTKPNEILDEVRRGIISALKQHEGGGGSKDGMDCSLINVETPNLGVSTLKIACANNPVYIVRQGALTEIKPDRQPVGFSYNPIPFTAHEIELSAKGGPRRIAGQKGDMIYLMSDGYEDQMGGEIHGERSRTKEKKFKSKRLKELLVSISDKSTQVQKEILEKTFDDWKGMREQTDDVTVIGIRIS